MQGRKLPLLTLQAVVAAAAVDEPTDVGEVLLHVNTTRARHPKKEGETALQDLEATGDWAVTVVHSKGHRWGVAKCRFKHRECQIGIWSTPRNAGNHARQIGRAAARCPGEDE